ncbi:unnamed protein product, partial [Prorocentrum cordatum]
MDRLVALWSLDAKNGAPLMKWRLCCLGGHVTSIRTDGANVLFVGCGDSSARIMDLMHREHRQHCWVLWRGLRSPITSLAPAPSPGIWAYGQQDGGFGMVPVSATDGPGKAEPLSSRSHPSGVSQVCWVRTAAFLAHLALGTGASGSTEEAACAEPPAAAAAEGGELEAQGSEQRPAPKQKGKKKAGPESRQCTDPELRGALQGLLLVSVSTGHQVLVTSGLPGGEHAARSVGLRLQPLAEAPALPCAAQTWEFPEGTGDGLVVAATHKSHKDSLEATSLQLFLPGEGDEPGPALAARSADGLDGGVASMALRARPGAQPCCSHALCGTSKGDLTVVLLQWPAQSEAAEAGPLWPVLARRRQAHGKGVTDVRWRDAAGTGDSGACMSAGLDGSVKVWSFGGPGGPNLPPLAGRPAGGPAA